MNRKPLIQLWDSVGLGLILECPSGVLVSNQTGGYSCLHPEVEGVFVPLRNDCLVPERTLLSPEIELMEYFEGYPHEGSGATSGLSPQDADFIEKILAKVNLHPAITIDRKLLDKSHEAWVHVTVASDESGHEVAVFSGFQYPAKGILTWSNSD